MLGCSFRNQRLWCCGFVLEQGLGSLSVGVSDRPAGEGSSVFTDNFIQLHSVTLVLPRVLAQLVLSLQEEAMGGAWPEAGEPRLQHQPGLGHPVKPTGGHWELFCFPPLLNSHSDLVRAMNCVLQTGSSGLSALAEVVPEELGGHGHGSSLGSMAARAQRS